MPSKCTQILIVSPCMGGYGGLEAFVLTIALGLTKIPRLNINVVFKRTKDFFLHDDLLLKVQASGLSVSFLNRSSPSLWRAIASADLVHLQNPCPDVVFMARLAGKPLLINVINHRKQIVSLRQIVWTFCLHLAHQRFYISNFVRRTWEFTETPWRNSRVVFPVCELSPLTPLPIGERSGFVFLARWIENKGLDTLVEAYANANLDPLKYPLRLLGSGPLWSQINTKVGQLGLKGITMPGFIGEYEKAELLRISRFAVIPPNTCEDFGLVAIEARHLGLPCIITTDGGLPEAAGRHCLSCDPGDVEGLKCLLLQAAAMNHEDYCTLATSAHESLESELIQPAFYSDTYALMLRHRSFHL